MLRSIFFIKLIHSLIFLLQSACVGIVAYSAIADRITAATWIALGLVLLEGVALALMRCRCPLTTYAERLGASSGSVTDIFLPKWFADRTFAICGTVYAVACVILVVRLLV